LHFGTYLSLEKEHSGDRKDNQNCEDGEGTGEEQIEKGAEQDAGAVGDFLSDMTESLGENEQQKTPRTHRTPSGTWDWRKNSGTRN